jgi:hypothetical protein
MSNKLDVSGGRCDLLCASRDGTCIASIVGRDRMLITCGKIYRGERSIRHYENRIYVDDMPQDDVIVQRMDNDGASTQTIVTQSRTVVITHRVLSTRITSSAMDKHTDV